jgi:hypothetical protein
MVDRIIVDDVKQSSPRARLDVLGDIAKGAVTYDIGATAIPNDNTATTWYEQTDTRMVLSNLVKNDSDIGWATLATGGTVDTMSLKKGRYLITIHAVARNTHASAVLDYRFGLSDDAATPAKFYGTTTQLLRAPAQNDHVAISKGVIVDLTDDDNVIYFNAACNAASGQSGQHEISGVSSITVQRLG